MKIGPIFLSQFIFPQHASEPGGNSMSDSNLQSRHIATTDVAIIGMHCRVPGANDTEQYWKNLRSGIESVMFFRDADLRAARVPESLVNDPRYVRAGTRIEGIELFDAGFFGFNPREAELMDPQLRLFLQASWEVIEGAGYDPQSYEGLIGLYGGMASNNYAANLLLDASLVQLIGAFSIGILNDRGSLATITSYKLNLRGPSVTVQTACSTSLVAVHMACQSLLEGECSMALAGGVSLQVPESRGYLYEEGGILSPDGHCRAFDAKAQGTTPGNGVCLVLLKRLEEALSDGDYIYAVIKGSAVNNDGSGKIGYTAPSIDGQAKVIRLAHAVAGVEAETISYVETHGTGTPLGDPIEIAALSEAFRGTTRKKRFCAIGSVKTNIGHLNAAAGAAGLIKTVLSLHNKQIPPSLHFETPNPNIDFENSPFFVNTHLYEWTSPRPLRAGVSSFGIGGTNAHIVLEEAPQRRPSQVSHRPQLLLLSAKTDGALQKATKNLSEYLIQHPEESLADVAYTLQVGRKHFPHRTMLVCQGREDAVRGLERSDREGATAPESGRSAVFLFPGQGAQFVQMGRELYEAERFFREVVDRCCERIKRLVGKELRQIITPDSATLEYAGEQLKQTAVIQPVLFVIEYALAHLWMQLGVKPQAMIGHSLGEYVAACVAGVLSEEEAINLVVIRGNLMQQVELGGMLAVQLPEEQLQNSLLPPLSMAAVNGPNQCVVSGPLPVIEEIEKQFDFDGIAYRRLSRTHAFHSQVMEPILERFGREVRKTKLRAPQIPYISNVTGNWITEAEATDPGYWVQHLRQPVRFAAAVQTIKRASKNRVWLEVGPGRTLSDLVRTNLGVPTDEIIIPTMVSVERDGGQLCDFLNSLGRLWLAGVPLTWQNLYRDEKRYRVPLPTYPFQRQRYWIDSSGNEIRTQATLRQPVRNSEIASWYYVPTWKQSFRGHFSAEHQHGLNWLVLLDDQGLGDELVQRLRLQGQDVFILKAGDKFLELTENTFSVRPNEVEDYEAVLAYLSRRQKSPNKIAHFWSITGQDSGKQTYFSVESQQLGFYSLLSLTKALAKQALLTPIEITVVSNNLHSVTGEEQVCPEKATVLGPC